MPRNGSGVYAAPPGTTATPNTVIESAKYNAFVTDAGQALTDSVNAQGTAPFQANQPMGGNKLTGLGAGTLASDSAKLSQVQDQIVSHATIVAGTVDAITATFSPAFTAYTANMRFRFTAAGANTVAAPTIAVDGLLAKTIKKLTGAALVAGDIAGSGHVCDCVYNGTDVILLNPAPGTISGAFALTAAISPAQIIASQNDYAPTGHATAYVIRIGTNAAGYSITGLAGGAAGRKLEIHNIGSFSIFLADESVSSTAANRFATENQSWALLHAGGIAYLTYDGASSRWRVAVGSGRRASASAMETATSENNPVVPLFQHRHPGHPKFWAYATVSGGTPTLQTSYNVTSITDAGVGYLTVTIATDFSSANWAPFVSGNHTTNNRIFQYDTVSAGAINARCSNTSAGLEDPNAWSVSGLGGQ